MLHYKISKTLCKPSTFPLVFKDILQTAQTLPFRLSLFLTRLIETYCISSSIDDVLFESFNSDNKVKFENEIHEGDSFEKLRNKLQYVNEIQKIYQEEYLLASNLNEIKNNLLYQLKAFEIEKKLELKLKKSCELVRNTPSDIGLSIIEKEIKEKENIGLEVLLFFTINF